MSRRERNLPFVPGAHSSRILVDGMKPKDLFPWSSLPDRLRLSREGTVRESFSTYRIRPSEDKEKPPQPWPECPFPVRRTTAKQKQAILRIMDHFTEVIRHLDLDPKTYPEVCWAYDLYRNNAVVTIFPEFIASSDDEEAAIILPTNCIDATRPYFSCRPVKRRKRYRKVWTEDVYPSLSREGDTAHREIVLPTMSSGVAHLSCKASTSATSQLPGTNSDKDGNIAEMRRKDEQEETHTVCTRSVTTIKISAAFPAIPSRKPKKRKITETEDDSNGSSETAKTVKPLVLKRHNSGAYETIRRKHGHKKQRTDDPQTEPETSTEVGDEPRTPVQEVPLSIIVFDEIGQSEPQACNLEQSNENTPQQESIESNMDQFSVPYLSAGNLQVVSGSGLAQHPQDPQPELGNPIDISVASTTLHEGVPRSNDTLNEIGQNQRHTSTRFPQPAWMESSVDHFPVPYLPGFNIEGFSGSRLQLRTGGPQNEPQNPPEVIVASSARPEEAQTSTTASNEIGQAGPGANEIGPQFDTVNSAMEQFPPPYLPGLNTYCNCGCGLEQRPGDPEPEPQNPSGTSVASTAPPVDLPHNTMTFNEILRAQLEAHLPAESHDYTLQPAQMRSEQEQFPAPYLPGLNIPGPSGSRLKQRTEDPPGSTSAIGVLSIACPEVVPPVNHVEIWPNEPLVSNEYTAPLNPDQRQFTVPYLPGLNAHHRGPSGTSAASTAPPVIVPPVNDIFNAVGQSAPQACTPQQSHAYALHTALMNLEQRQFPAPYLPGLNFEGFSGSGLLPPPISVLPPPLPVLRNPYQPLPGWPYQPLSGWPYRPLPDLYGVNVAHSIPYPICSLLYPTSSTVAQPSSREVSDSEASSHSSASAQSSPIYPFQDIPHHIPQYPEYGMPPPTVIPPSLLYLTTAECIHLMELLEQCSPRC